MKSSTALRNQIETALYRKVPGALSPQIRPERIRLATGVKAVDAVTRGGFPVGAVTEVVGSECSGRTTLAASFVASRMSDGIVFAWVDVSDSLEPESMAAAGVDLERMLWVRCGGSREHPGGSVAPHVQADEAPVGPMLDRTMSAPSLSGGCGSPHPRSEGRGLSEAIGGLMGGLAADLMLGGQPADKQHPGWNKALLPQKRKDRSIGTPSAPNREVAARSSFSWRSEDRVEQVPTDRVPARRGEDWISQRSGPWQPRCAEPERLRCNDEPSAPTLRQTQKPLQMPETSFAAKSRLAPRAESKSLKGMPWSAIDQALRATDMLLQAGGFGVIVLDLAGVAPEAVWKIPMATWFRFRAAADRSRACLVLLTQYPCARSSAELVLEMQMGEMQSEGRVMTGVAYGVRVGRQRFVVAEAAKVVPIREAQRQVQPEDVERRRQPQPERTGAWHGTAAWAKASSVDGVRTTAAERRVRGRKRRVG